MSDPELETTAPPVPAEYSPNGQATTKLLGADDIVAANDVTYEIVHVPEWGGFVRVKSLLAEERAALEVQAVRFDEDGKSVIDTSQYRVNLVMLSLVDATGNRLFTGDLGRARLNKKSAAGIHRVFEVAQRLSGLGADAEETLQGNSDGGRSTVVL